MRSCKRHTLEESTKIGSFSTKAIEQRYLRGLSPFPHATLSKHAEVSSKQSSIPIKDMDVIILLMSGNPRSGLRPKERKTTGISALEKIQTRHDMGNYLRLECTVTKVPSR